VPGFGRVFFMERIAIQGGYGVFHELAAHKYFGGEEIEILPRETFRDLLSSLKQRKSDYGIMAILQCSRYFDQFPQIRLIESADTALSAKEISDKQLSNIGAIASRLAANKYNLDILAEGIETNKMNYTRFLILTENGKSVSASEINKSSIHFALAHKTGSLSKILSILSYYGLNLEKIQSMPIIGQDWEYQFYVDLEIDDYDLYKKSLEAIKPFTSGLGIMGEYVKGSVYFE